MLAEKETNAVQEQLMRVSVERPRASHADECMLACTRFFSGARPDNTGNRDVLP